MKRDHPFTGQVIQVRTFLNPYINDTSSGVNTVLLFNNNNSFNLL